MTEQSDAFNTVPPKDGKGSTSPTPLAESFRRIIEQSAENANTSNQNGHCRSYEETARLHRAQVAYDASGLPQRHRAHAGDLTSLPEWSEARRKVCGRTGEGFLLALVGERGPGKTQIAEQAIRSACDRWSYDLDPVRPPAKYLRAMNLFLYIRASYRKGAEQSEEQVIESLRKPRLLVIDEMQERGDTAWEDRLLTNLVDTRYGDQTDTLLIANLTPAALMDSLGPSIYDRLCETGGIIECNWPSFRVPQKDPAPF